MHTDASLGAVHEARVRRWLTNLARPEQLADPHMAALLRAHGRPSSGSPVDVGRAGARLLADAIEALAPPSGTPRSGALPYRVLRTCFVDGAKSRQAAASLGMSERQLSRERSRAVSLLTAHLARSRAGRGALPPPLPDPFVPRPDLGAALAGAVRGRPRVRVTGAPGSGKTTLAAAYAAVAGTEVFWYRGRVRSGDALAALLFDLGEHLAPQDPSLATYVRDALPRVDLGVASRIALAALEGRGRLIVLDGHDGRVDTVVDAFLDEAAARAPVTVVEVGGRATRGPGVVHVPALSVAETRELVVRCGLPAGDDVVAAVHAWTGGNAATVAAAAAWMAREPERWRLEDALRRPAATLTSLRALAPTAGRAAA
ncbi:MAG TPA: hypothetical protein VHN37_08780 [Actinomycetota bacterium]|nr:hypothetical protein [Actinomycetota bacterium]